MTWDNPNVIPGWLTKIPAFKYSSCMYSVHVLGKKLACTLDTHQRFQDKQPRAYPWHGRMAGLVHSVQGLR